MYIKYPRRLNLRGYFNFIVILTMSRLENIHYPFHHCVQGILDRINKSASV